MKNLNIVIAGQVMTGKTTVCQLIENTLREHGFNNIKISGEEENNIRRMTRTLPDRIKNMGKDIKIEIRTVQFKREHLTI